MKAPDPAFETTEEQAALNVFREANSDLFQKNDSRLLLHLGLTFSLLASLTAIVLLTPWIGVKIMLGIFNSFLWFSLINATIHHHHTHHNAAKSPFCKRMLDFIYLISMPNAPKRLPRYTRAHLNHHARPFHETDVDHHHGKNQFIAMSKNLLTRVLYYLELTFIGGYVPGWGDNRYLTQVPLEDWSQDDYAKVKEKEIKDARLMACIQWTGFFLLLWIVPWVAWGWAFPMLLVKNWSHFLGQFQHFDDQLLDPSRSALNRTKSYRFPSWLNYLAGGEINGHFFHHLYPEMPYYNVERARKRFIKDETLFNRFVTY